MGIVGKNLETQPKKGTNGKHGAMSKGERILAKPNIIDARMF